MGDILTPRNGEGELFEVAGSLPEGFSRMSVEVLPFEHRVFRMVLENSAVKGTGDVLECASEFLQKHFNISFKRVDDNRLAAETPDIRIELYRAFYLGPRAAAVEFIDRKMAAQASELKRSARYTQIRKFQFLRNELRLLAQGISDFRLDTGVLPEKLDDLRSRPAGMTLWNGPYCRNLPESAVVYQKLDTEKDYDLYIDCDGKRIREDSSL